MLFVRLNIFYCKTIQRDLTQVINNIMKSSPLILQTVSKGTVVITTFFIHIYRTGRFVIGHERWRLHKLICNLKENI